MGQHASCGMQMDYVDGRMGMAIGDRGGEFVCIGSRSCEIEIYFYFKNKKRK